MLTFGEKLKQARISKKLTQKQLSDKLDVSNTVISNWEKNINRPDVDILEVMCGILDIEPNSLFNVKNNDNSTYSLVEKKLVSDYRRLDDHGKKAVNVIMNVELERIDKIATGPNYDNIIPIKKYQVPYYDMPVSAGTGNPKRLTLWSNRQRVQILLSVYRVTVWSQHITTAISYSSKNSQVLKSVKSGYLLWTVTHTLRN